MAKLLRFQTYYQSNIPFKAVMEYAPTLLKCWGYEINEEESDLPSSAFDKNNTPLHNVVFLKKNGNVNLLLPSKKHPARVEIKDWGKKGTSFELIMDSKGKFENELEEFLLTLKDHLKDDGYKDIKIKLINQSSDASIS